MWPEPKALCFELKITSPRNNQSDSVKPVAGKKVESRMKRTEWIYRRLTLSSLLTR
jgi:hypothetical protein